MAGTSSASSNSIPSAPTSSNNDLVVYGLLTHMSVSDILRLITIVSEDRVAL